MTTPALTVQAAKHTAAAFAAVARRSRLLLLAAGAFFCLSVAHVDAGMLGFRDFALLDFGNTGQRVEPGATGISASGNGVSTGPVTVTAENGDMFDVSVSAVDWRDRGDASNGSDALVRMGEDHVKVNSGTISVTLAGLPAGVYQATSFHVDAAFELADTIEISVTDVLGTSVLQSVTGNGGQLGRGPGPYSPIQVTTSVMEDSSAEFLIVSNGVDDIVLTFDGSSSTNTNAPQFPLSGLELQLGIVPEPGALSLFGLPLLSVLWARRRRRSR